MNPKSIISAKRPAEPEERHLCTPLDSGVKAAGSLDFLSPLPRRFPLSCFILTPVWHVFLSPSSNWAQQFFPVILYLSGKLWIVRDSSHLAPQILRGAVHRIQPCPFSWFLVSNPNRFWKKYSLEWFKSLVLFFKSWSIVDIRGFPRGSDSKESACHEGDLGLIWSGRPPGEGNGNPLQYCCRGQRSLAGYSPWGHEESDMIEH